MGNLTVDMTRCIDFYPINQDDTYVNQYKQASILSIVDNSGKLTETIVKAENLTDAQKSAMVANGIEFDNYGNAYYVTENHSRFLHYGVDSSGQLYVFNYAGEKMKVASDGSLLDPQTNVKAETEIARDFLSQIKATYDITWNGISATGISLTRVIMLVTLIRAEKIEEQLVNQMDELAKRTATLKNSADAEQFILDNYTQTLNNTTRYSWSDEVAVYAVTLKEYLTDYVGISLTFPADDADWSQSFKDQVISAIQSKQDELNTISQETSINIQSLINKRDQSYLLGTNANSLFYSGPISAARNI